MIARKVTVLAALLLALAAGCSSVSRMEARMAGIEKSTDRVIVQVDHLSEALDTGIEQIGADTAAMVKDIRQLVVNTGSVNRETASINRKIRRLLLFGGTFLLLLLAVSLALNLRLWRQAKEVTSPPS